MEGLEIPDHGMFQYAKKLIGFRDATLWFQTHRKLFENPRFVNDWVTEYAVRRIMKTYNISGDTVWAHPHEDWKTKFGIYIVRKGIDVIYEGRDERRVQELLQ